MEDQRPHNPLMIPEIMSNISSHLSRSSDLRNLCLVSRLCRQSALPHLYHKPLLVFDEHHEDMIRRFCASDAIIHVRHLVIAPVYARSSIRREEREARSRVFNMVHRICWAVPRDQLLSLSCHIITTQTGTLVVQRQVKAREQGLTNPAADDFLVFGEGDGWVEHEARALQTSRASYIDRYRSVGELVRGSARHTFVL